MTYDYVDRGVDVRMVLCSIVERVPYGQQGIDIRGPISD